MSSVSKAHLAALAGLLLAAACTKGEAAQPGPTATEQAPAESEPQAAPVADVKGEAAQMFRSRCIVCHGEKGHGDGPGAAALNPKPRNYGDGAWQASVTDEQIKNVIMNGGAAVGKSPIMPASPDLQSKPEVVDELVKIVRSFKPH